MRQFVVRLVNARGRRVLGRVGSLPALFPVVDCAGDSNLASGQSRTVVVESTAGEPGTYRCNLRIFTARARRLRKGAVQARVRRVA